MLKRYTFRFALMVTAISFATACDSCEDPPPATGNNGVNNGTNNGTNNGLNNGSNNGVNNGTNNGTNNGINNGTNNGTNNGVTPDSATQAFHFCAAAGESTGGGFRAIHCLGPADLGDFEASGNGFVWQPGAAHVVLADE